MSYWINQAGNSNRADWRSFYCDEDKDVDSLPNSKEKGVLQDVDPVANHCCSIGSACLSLATGNIFLLGSDDIWVPVSSGSGGGSGAPGKDGASAYEIAVENGFEGTEEEWLASLVGQPGLDGFSPTITENEENTSSVYKLDITTKSGSFTTPNLKGKDASSTAANVPIESISVNGETVSPVDKNVDITVPSKTSDLQNDSDFIEGSELSTVATSGSYNDLKDKPESLPASDVYDWAKSDTKPSYTASEVGAMPEDANVPLNFSIGRHNDIGTSPIIDVKFGDPQEIKFSFYSPFEYFSGNNCFIAKELYTFYQELGGHPESYNMIPWGEDDDIANLTEENGPYLVLTTEYSENTSDTESSFYIYTYVSSLKDCFEGYIKETKEYSELTTNSKTIIGAINELNDRLKIDEV